MTRRQLSLRLLSITRRVLPPLAASIAARIVFLMIGIALFALGGWAVAGLALGGERLEHRPRHCLCDWPESAQGPGPLP